MGHLPSTIIVVPCYNEAGRLPLAELAALMHRSNVGLLFVNDGSTDGTGVLLQGVCARYPDRCTLLELPRNAGKAEAVRGGLRQALDAGADVVGYVDADFATPAHEVERLVERMAAGGYDVIMGARIRHLGANIDRRARRHYLGRIFATVASGVLRLPVYDTQCGAKLFRRSTVLGAALQVPFLSRWAFDVELLGRLTVGTRDAAGLPPERFLEVPLIEWRDVAGSKLRPWDIVRLGLDLGRTWLDLRRRARARHTAADG